MTCCERGALSAVTALTIVLLIAATAACVALIWASREAVQTARSVRDLSDDVRERAVPILDKLDVTVDATNAELLRIDSAVTRFEEASVKVSVASSALADFVSAPADIVGGVAERMRRAWKDRRRPSDVAPESDPSEQEPGFPEPSPQAYADTQEGDRADSEAAQVPVADDSDEAPSETHATPDTTEDRWPKITSR